MGNSDGSVYQFIEIDAYVPEFLLDESLVKVQASFSVQLEAGVMEEMQQLESWASVEYMDYTFSLQCTSFIGERYSDVNFYIGEYGSNMFDADNQDA